MYKVEFWLDDNHSLQALKKHITATYDFDSTIEFDRLSFEVEKTDLKPIITQLKKHIKRNFECDFDFDYELLEDEINSGFTTYNPYAEYGVNELNFY